MFGSEEEYVMDFKAEERRTQMAHFHADDNASDCSTISASEVNSHDSNDSTSTPFYKLKNVRVLIKRLPRNILSKYKINCNEIPSRSSGRIKSKHIPVGKYLALHKNTPLDKLITKKIRQTPISSNIAEKTKSKIQKRIINLPGSNSIKRYLETTSLTSDSISKSENDVVTPTKYSQNRFSITSRRYLYNKFSSTSGKSYYKHKASSMNSQPNVHKRSGSPSNDTRSLHERIAATRIIEKPRETLPNLPEVVITRYNMPPNSRNNFAIKSVPNSMSRNTGQNDKRPTASQPKFRPQQNVQSKVFPAFLTPAPTINQGRRLMPSNATIKALNNDRLQRHSFPKSGRKFTIQAYRIAKNSPKTNDPVPVTSASVFVVNQSLLGSNPVNMPKSGNKITKTTERLIGKANAASNGMEICVDSDSDVEQIDVEKEIKTQVIKRIIYHTKAVQTKFTCNSSICGLVDTGDFNLNCFYCYDKFPLHKWYEFKEHIKVEHHAEETANLSDSDASSSDNAHSPIPSPTSEDVPTPAQQVFKKLPLEPRLVAQRQSKVFAEPSKIFSSTPTTAKPSEIIDQSSKTIKKVRFNTKRIDEIISVDSDDGDLNGVCKIAKGDMLQTQKTVANKNPQLVNKAVQINDSKIVVPSLPHITIKKVSKVFPKENNVGLRTAAKPSNENVVKTPCTTNVQKIIKTLPKPTESQLAASDKTKPRYFVVKKIIKLPTTEEVSKVSDMNFSRSRLLAHMQLNSKTSLSMESNNNIEDAVPKPTSGLGILFGLTNSMVVIEFLLKLKTFPELWHNKLKNINPLKYNESMKRLCVHLNNRFDLNMTEFEMLLSIQRVKDWYYLMLQSIHEHNKDPNNTEPYKHRFPIYFKILSQYLAPDTDERGIRLNEIINKTALAAKASVANLNQNAPLKANEMNTQSSVENINNTQLSRVSSTTVSVESSTKDYSQNQEANADNLIEFDADTLYDQESSAEESLEEFDDSIFFNKKPNKKTANADGTQKRRRKTFVGHFECDICHKVCRRECDLKRHKLLHFPPQFQCSGCPQKFYFQRKAEKCTHQKKKTYIRVDKSSGEKRIWPKKVFEFNMICEICGNSYRSIGSLNTHKKDKHFNKRDRCIVCNFTALSNWRIVQHQRKRHIVEPGLPEDVAKKSRARTETKTSFSNEARQAFDWRREMRKKMKPGEKFFGCCRCKIIFNTRKEKVLHNKTEHPITEETVVCLLCLPNKLLLSNSNSARRHYTDIHKVPWHEIDELVKCTKPIFSLLSKEEIELLKASENYKELLDELLKDKKLQSVANVQILEDEASKAVQNLPHINVQPEDESAKTEVVECTQEETVYVDGVIDNYHYSDSNYKTVGYATTNEHNYSEEQVINESYNEFDVLVDNHVDELYSQPPCVEEAVHINADTENNDYTMVNYIQNAENNVQDFVEGELVEESIVVEEYVDDIISEYAEEFV